MRIAIAADWLTTFGGAEHVLIDMHRAFPDAPMFTTVACPARGPFGRVKRSTLGPLADADTRTSGLQKWFRVIGHHQVLLPWMPRAMESLDLRGYDVILSSSHAVGKGIIPPGDAVHVCYCHTPVRYAWEMEEQYLEDFRVPHILRPKARALLKRLRRWDLCTAKRVDVFLANSRETQDRIMRIYGRQSTVLPPPVDDRFFAVPLVEKRERFLAVGRLVPYKRFDLLIEASNALKFPLTIVGKGQELSRLRKMAGPHVTFVGYVPDDQLPALYASARAVLFPQHEDAGIVPLEAQACGTPVIAFNRGGARDAVVENVTGVFFDEQTVASLGAALQRFEQWSFAPDAIRAHARQFDSDGFRKRLRAVVEAAAKSRILSA